MTILVLQSARPDDRGGWIGRCLASVQAWAQTRGYAYRLLGDELFDDVPTWYLQKVAGRMPIAADYARLQWADKLLRSDETHVVAWLDADVLAFAPDHLEVTLEQDAVFGRENWLARDGGRIRVHRNVHNAYAAFEKGSPTLAFLQDRIERMMARVDPEHIAPQFVGPKLLTSLNNIVGFQVVEDVGALSPLLASALLEGDDGVLDVLTRRADGPMYAANLCASLHPGDHDMDALIDLLQSDFAHGLGG